MSIVRVRHRFTVRKTTLQEHLEGGAIVGINPTLDVIEARSAFTHWG